jgi:predicted amidohydrolase YtcJ
VSASTGAPASPTTGEGSSSSGSETGGGATTASSSGGAGEGLLFADGHVVGLGVADIRVVDGKIAAVGQLSPGPDDTIIELGGRWVAPAFIDSHVHLVYAPAAAEFAFLVGIPTLLAAGAKEAWDVRNSPEAHEPWPMILLACAVAASKAHCKAMHRCTSGYSASGCWARASRISASARGSLGWLRC